MRDDQQPCTSRSPQKIIPSIAVIRAATEGPCNRLLHRTEISVPPIVRVHGQQRRLREEPWTRTSMRLRGMDQERMTQVHRAGVPRGSGDGAMSARREAVSGEFPQRQPLFSRGRKLPGDVGVRPDPNTRRRIGLPHVGKQEQHQ